MDARAQFFARMDASYEEERRRADDHSEGTDFDMDFGITESGRTTIRDLTVSERTGDEMDISVIGSNSVRMLSTERSLGGILNTDRSMATVATMGTIGTVETEVSLRTVDSSILDTRIPSERNSDKKPKAKKSEDDKVRDSNKEQGDQEQHEFTAPKDRLRSAPRAVPKPQTIPPQHPQTLLGPSQSEPNSSAESNASAFLNSLLDPAATTFNNTHMSHTPPTHLATSYEASHFGKRARSGSVSERVKMSAELEQKGMIDKEQKGILKDLIISGQDLELQHALDRYEQGDTKLLETMLQNGTLTNKATSDIDLLGDLDLDFLTVNDTVMREVAGQNIAYNPTSNNPINPPAQHVPGMNGASVYEASDGIGDLEFDGGMGGNDTLSPMPQSGGQSPMYNPGQRSRSNSTLSVDLDFRQRSNSLFSALIGSAPQEGGSLEYGRWMERAEHIAQAGLAPEAIAASPIESPNGHDMSMVDDPRLTAAQKREMRAEEKRRERLAKKEQKEREKREKKEKREQAKMDKQKKTDTEEKEEHVSGSGRPRSMSDPNLRSSIDSDGLLHVERPEGWIGAYSPASRKVRIARFLEKRNHRVWTKTVKYDVRKNFADSRLRVKGRFVKKEDELLMRELMSLT